MTAGKPLFSVIVSTYNRARMARSALRTVQAQTFSDWECVVADDGSTDDTKEVLAPFAKDPRFKLLFAGVNRGMNASRNGAIEQASGEFIALLDSDDFWLPRRLEAFAERSKRSPEAGFLFSNAWVLRFGRIVGTHFDPARPIPEGVLPGDYAVGEDQLPYVTTNLAIRREAYRKWGLYRPEIRTSDTELYARFVGKGLPVAVIREPLSVRRIHGAQLTDRYVQNFNEALLALASSGVSVSAQAAKRRALVSEVATYLLKSGQPADARAFLDKELGAEARGLSLYLLTRVPAFALKAAAGARRLWLTARHHPAFASAQARAAYAAIAPLLAEEAA